MKKSYSEIVKILQSKGFKEECPLKSRSRWFKFPFMVEIGDIFISYRIDKEYRYNDVGKLVIA